MQLALPRFDRTLLATTSALIGAAALLFVSPAHAAFDPNAGANAPVASSSPTRLPDTAVLGDDMPVRPLYAPAGTPVATPYASPLKPIQMPRPLYPARVNASAQPVAVPAEVRTAPAPIAITTPASGTSPAMIAPAPVLAAMPAPTAPTPTMPNMPPVDADTAARAEAIMQAEQQRAKPAPIVIAAPVANAPTVASTTPGVLPGTFIAPAPVLARSPVSAPVVATAPAPAAMPPQPVVIAAPSALPPALPAPMVVAAKPPVDDISPIVQPDLSSQSRETLANVPSRMDSPVATKSTKVNLERVSPQIANVLGGKVEEDNYESAGISIKVRRPGLDTNYELNSAYNALMGGDTQQAIQTYKNILSTEPRNEDALFGLAATYHRLGMETQARPYYAALLKFNPNHREALNNFLVLVSSESPADALPELERLEIRNPDFSPIPAQIAILYDRLGYPDQAREKMLRAIDLAPENLTYKYNLAIMLDRQKHYADAVALYRLLIQASLNGETVPASVESMEKRVNYISTAATSGRLGS